MTPARLAAVAETDAGWVAFKCDGRTTDIWCDDATMQRIRAGISSGTVEVRVVRERARRIWQWREVAVS